MPSNPIIRSFPRERLAAILKSDDLVRLFEALLTNVRDTLPDAVDSVVGIANSAQTAASNALTTANAVQSRTVNGHPLTADVTVTAGDVGAVPLTRTVNAKPLSADITLSASDVGAPSGSGTSTGTNTGDQFTSQAASTLVGRGSAAGAGAAQSIALGSGLSMSGTTLSASDVTLLANVTLASAGTSLASGTITARKNLRIRIRIPGYAGSDTASLQFNGAAGTAYRYRWLTCAAAATTFAAGLVAASTDRIKIAAANTTNSRIVECFINNDASVTEKLVKFESQFGTGSAGTQDTIDLGQGAWISGSSTQITSVSLISSSNMNAGTEMTIWGWD